MINSITKIIIVFVLIILIINYIIMYNLILSYKDDNMSKRTNIQGYVKKIPMLYYLTSFCIMEFTKADEELWKNAKR